MGKTSVMKKIVHYLQEQAVHQSSSAIYLTPGGHEPHQRSQHRQMHYINDYQNSAAISRTSSTQSTRFPLPPDMRTRQYASQNILQSYSVYIPPPASPRSAPSNHSEKYFVIYLHGGYYRDPKVTAASFNPALSLLTSSPLHAKTRTHISGYASVNYRLSPHPDHPQDPDKTSPYELRNATHPEHVEDVITAIADLQRRYKFGSNYVLLGHSVGATLALQAALCGCAPWQPPPSPSDPHPTAADDGQSEITVLNPLAEIDPPAAIIGINGIYSFPLIHQSHPAYETITSNALSQSPEIHKSASPASYGPGVLSGAGKTRHIILAASHTDSLVPWTQVECMRDVFADDVETDLEVQVVEVQGDHNEVWEKGEDLARVVRLALLKLRAE